MPYLQSVSPNDLRRMAQDATSLYLQGGPSLEDAIIKVASAFDRPLTSEHVRRVCEMSYHNTFERSFRQGGSHGQVVNFTPADAEKVAEALQAQHVQSYQDKVAQVTGRRVRQAVTAPKTASALTDIPPPPANAFSTAMDQFGDDGAQQHLEKVADLRTAREALRDAVRTMETRIDTVKHAEVLEYRELGKIAQQEVTDGTPPSHIAVAVTAYMKEAGIATPVVESVLEDILGDMLEGGVKIAVAAELEDWTPVRGHPLERHSIRVGELRGEKIAGEVALDDLRTQQRAIEYALKEANLLGYAAKGALRTTGAAIHGSGKRLWGVSKALTGSRLGAAGVLATGAGTAALGAPSVAGEIRKNFMAVRSPLKGVR